jgi:DNA polymerase-3 subunit alpha
LGSGFVHLHNHTEYSILDGAARINVMFEKAARLGMPAIAVTDHGVMYGAIDVLDAGRRMGVKPIIGCDVWITNDKERDQPHRLLLLAMNHSGYHNLCELLSRAWLENQHRGRAEIRLEWLGRAPATSAENAVVLAQAGTHGSAGP